MADETEDNRPLVKDLLDQHAATIDAVKSNIKDDPLYDAKKYDDLWILRFVLSKKTEKKATKAAIATMAYRKEQKIDELGDMRRKFLHPQQDSQLDSLQKKYLYCNPEWSFILYHPDEDKSLMQIIDLSITDMHKMGKTLNTQELMGVYMRLNECMFQILDETTRRTGRLTKICRILSLGAKFSAKMFSPTYVNADSKAAKEMQDYYPQLLGSVLVIDAPSAIGAVWKVMKHLFPKSVVEKFDFIYPTKNEKDMKPLLNYVSREHLPKFLGGTREVWPPTEQRATSNAFM